jgi:hypothetical protein
VEKRLQELEDLIELPHSGKMTDRIAAIEEATGIIEIS